MKKITFIGTLNSTFASRWREKLLPGTVAKGKMLAEDKRFNNDYIKEKGRTKSAIKNEIWNTTEIENTKKQSALVKARKRIDNIPFNDPLLKSREDRNKETRAKKQAKRRDATKAPKRMTKPVRRDIKIGLRIAKKEAQNELRKTFEGVKSIPKKGEGFTTNRLSDKTTEAVNRINQNKVKTKYQRKIYIDANQRKEFLTNVAKKRKFARAIRTGGKLGLGAVGLATLGAVGYGVARKLRSDKGKKRGRYFK